MYASCSWLAAGILATAVDSGANGRVALTALHTQHTSNASRKERDLYSRPPFPHPSPPPHPRSYSDAANLLTERMVRLSGLPPEVADQCRAQWYNALPVTSVVPGVGRAACCTGCDTGFINARLSDAQRAALNISWTTPNNYRHNVGNVWRLGVPHNDDLQLLGDELHLLCTKKTGVTLWTRFLLKIFTDAGKVQPKWIGGSAHTASNTPLKSSRIPPGAPAVLVTRNPYTRFLSAILDKGPPPEMLNAINQELLARGYRILEPNPNRKKQQVDKHSRPWKRVITPATFRLAVDVLHKRYLEHDRSWGFPSHETEVRVLRSSLVDNPHFWPQTAILLQFKYQCPPLAHAEAWITVKVEEEPKWFLCLMRAAGLRLSDVMSGFQGVRRLDQTVSPWEDEDCFWHPKGTNCTWLSANWDTPGVLAAELPDALPNNNGNLNNGGGGRQHAADAPTWGQHNHGADALANQFYDEASAACITEIFKSDFDLLDYPVWDGVTRGMFD